MESKSDEQLLADHLSGVSNAFDRLVARYVNELFGFLCRFVGNATVAEDLVQETFVQVHNAAASFDPERSFKPWLYTIAANKARDYMRSRGRRPFVSIDAPAPGAGDSGSPAQNLEADTIPLPEQVANEELRAAVREVIERMPEHLRLILVMGYFQQLAYADIAEALKIPIGTVKSRLHAAVQHFARLWRNQTQTDSTTKL